MRPNLPLLLDQANRVAVPAISSSSRLRSGASALVLAVVFSASSVSAVAPLNHSFTAGEDLMPLAFTAESSARAPGDDEDDDESDEEAEEQAEEQAEQQAEEDAEEEAENQAENEAEDRAEEQAEMQAENQAEMQAEEQAEDNAEGDAEDEAEDQAENEAEDQAEEQAEMQAEDDAEGDAEDEAEDQAENEAEDQAEEQAEMQAENDVEDQAESQAEMQAENDVEDQAESQAEMQAENNMEDQAESQAEMQAENDVEDQAAMQAEMQAEVDVEDQAEMQAEMQTEMQSENDVDEKTEEATEAEVDVVVEEGANASAADDRINQNNSMQGMAQRMDSNTMRATHLIISKGPNEQAGDGRKNERSGNPAKAYAGFSEQKNTLVEREFDETMDENGDFIIADEILILADAEGDIELDAAQLSQQEVIYLEGLGMYLARVRVKDPAQIANQLKSVTRTLKNGFADANHIYATDGSTSISANKAAQPGALADRLGLAPDGGSGLRIGLIDTDIDRTHAAFASANIRAEDFVPYKSVRPKNHGTAIAAILVGDQPSIFKGLSPSTQLYAAGVFAQNSAGSPVATAESLVRAIDWMVREKISFINMSLSGPANGLLEVAINRAAERGTYVIAAVGNAGPNAKPLFPAAYPVVVAVTAVDKNTRVFLRANRGRHVDFAAPGVDVICANAGGGYIQKTGTSIAAPFVATILAQMAGSHRDLSPMQIIHRLEMSATDLGKPGYDPVYGHGLISLGTH
jgi:subtilisin family serine protease